MKILLALLCAGVVGGCAGKSSSSRVPLDQLREADRACMAGVESQLNDSRQSWEAIIALCRPTSGGVSKAAAEIADCQSKVRAHRDEVLAQAKVNLTEVCDTKWRVMVFQSNLGAQPERVRELSDLNASMQRQEQQRQIDYRLRQIEQQQRNLEAAAQNEHLRQAGEEQRRAITNSVR